MRTHARLHLRSAAAAAVALAAALVLATGCSSGSSSDGSTSTTAAGNPSTGEPEPTDPVLEALALDDADLAEGEQAVVPTDGTSVELASPTMEHCGVALAADGQRVARHRVQVADEAFAPVASSDAVRYEDGAGIGAMTEIRGAFIDCPDGAPVEIDGQQVTFAAMPMVEDELDGLADDHVAADVTVTTPDGETEVRMVFQRRGDVVVATIGPDAERVLALANAAGARLEAADGADVGD